MYMKDYNMKYTLRDWIEGFLLIAMIIIVSMAPIYMEIK